MKIKKLLCTVLILSGTVIWNTQVVSAHGVGYSFGPVGNEIMLLKESIGEILYLNIDRMESYDRNTPPIGGIYFRYDLPKNNFAGYIDIQYTYHDIIYNATGGDKTCSNNMIYSHLELNWFPRPQNLFFIGAGMEFILMNIQFPDYTGSAFKVKEIDTYITTRNFLNAVIGIRIPISFIEFGIKYNHRFRHILETGGEGSASFFLGAHF